MSGMLFDAIHQGLGNVLDLRDQQAALTVSNVVNADTSGYLAKEIDFSTLLAEVMQTGDGMEMRRTLDRHFGSSGVNILEPMILEKEAPASSLNGNSVQLEGEITKHTANALMYSAVANGLSRRLAILRFAASNGKS
jgi:flagellar basal-body rod protein FlgB